MLTLTMKSGEHIFIGVDQNIFVGFVTEGSRIIVSIEAPKDEVPVVRGNISDKKPPESWNRKVKKCRRKKMLTFNA